MFPGSTREFKFLPCLGLVSDLNNGDSILGSVVLGNSEEWIMEDLKERLPLSFADNEIPNGEEIFTVFPEWLSPDLLKY